MRRARLTPVARRVGGLGAVVAVVGAGALDLPPTVAAAFGVLAAGAVWMATSAGRTSSDPTQLDAGADLAERILAAPSATAVEDICRTVVTNTLSGWGPMWVAVSTRAMTDQQLRDPAVRHQLGRVLTQLPHDVRRPTRVALPVGEVLCCPCGGGSNAVLAVATRDPVDEVAARFIGELAVIVGLGGMMRKADELLHEHRDTARFEELVRFASDAIIVVDEAGEVKYVAPSVTTVLGHRSGEVVGRKFAGLVVPDQVAETTAFLLDVGRQDPRDVGTADLTFLGVDGREIHGEVKGANLLANADVAGIVVTVRDVTSRRTLENKLRHQAFHDSLTGLANRTLFNNRLAAAIRSRRPGSFGPAVVFIDLDDFKLVNDSLGHDAGDLLLRTVGERIRCELRGTDTASRLGGDEFALVIGGMPGKDALMELVRRVVDAVSAPIPFPTPSGEQLIEVRASVGVAVVDDNVDSAEDLVTCADVAMYQAKLRGKAQLALYEPHMRVAASDRLTLTAELHSAVDADEFEVHYQPIVALATEEVVGVEAFTCWSHPTRGMLAPDTFLDVAEETGVIVPIGMSVLATSVDALAAWRSDRYPDIRLSIDLTPRMLQDPDFERALFERLDDAGLGPEAVVLEVSERVFRRRAEGTQERVRALAARGCAVAIDDFGASGSAVCVLPHLPIEQVKLDAGLVSRLRDPRERAVARSLVDLAHELGAATVACGIDEDDVLDVLRDLGCTHGQGLRFGRPRGRRVALSQLRSVDDTRRPA